MLVISSTSLLYSLLSTQKKLGRSVGFIPTMGALHAGHLSLVKQCRATAQVSVCSIFVNPTQFNQTSDLDQYPRTPEADQKMLEEVGCDILFLPSVDAIYPKGTNYASQFDLQGLDLPLEGAFRPGHFAGVVQVVSRFLDLVHPDYLFMGQKDYQQFAIIRHLINIQKRDTQILMGPTVREPDGLAMSSRNVRLSSKFRTKAPVVFQTLGFAKEALAQLSIAAIEAEAVERLKQAGLKVEYFSIVDAHTLSQVDKPRTGQSLVACVAVWAGSVRLIDNLILV